MKGKAKPGKQRTHSGAKKRVKVSGSGQLSMQKAAHSHRLNQKSKGQKVMGGRRSEVHASDEKRFKTLLWQ